MPPKKNSGFYISWTTITYRSVAVAILVILLMVGVGAHLAFPETTRAGVESAERLARGIADRLGLDLGSGKPLPNGSQFAYFTQIDGTVRVKKQNSNTWMTAVYNLALEKGDVVQTTSEGMAKVVFADGTSYTVKQDSLIVIEENSTLSNRQTQVAVQVTTGTVDLNTSTYMQGSKNEVIVAGATASLAPDTSAMVRNDPRAAQGEILVKKGAGEVRRGNQVVSLTDYEKVSVQAGGPMTKQKEMRPPTLISPSNMMPIFITERARTVHFSWTPVENTRGYRIRISRNPYFTSHVVDRRVAATELRLTNLGEGAYYWLVQSVDSGGKESVESERNRFTVIPKGNEDVALLLELDPFVQHGHVIEVRGKTEPQARVMVNGQEVPLVQKDGRFSFFTPPLPKGENIVTVTAHNAIGGVSTQQKKVVIQ